MPVFDLPRLVEVSENTVPKLSSTLYDVSPYPCPPCPPSNIYYPILEKDKIDPDTLLSFINYARHIFDTDELEKEFNTLMHKVIAKRIPIDTPIIGTIITIASRLYGFNIQEFLDASLRDKEKIIKTPEFKTFLDKMNVLVGIYTNPSVLLPHLEIIPRQRYRKSVLGKRLRRKNTKSKTR